MDHVQTASLLIRLGVGVVMVLFGLSQLRSPELWLTYIPRIIRFFMPMEPKIFMRIHSLGNLGLGLLLCLGIWFPVILWITIFWWISILPFAFYYEYTVGLRDVSIILALIALLMLHYA